MMKVQNWCTNNDIAKALNVSSDTAKNYIDVLRGRNFVIYQQTNEVKRLNADFEVEIEYVVNYPIELMLPLIKETLNIS